MKKRRGDGTPIAMNDKSRGHAIRTVAGMLVLVLFGIGIATN
jgi:hypothetical protein